MNSLSRRDALKAGSALLAGSSWASGDEAPVKPRPVAAVVTVYPKNPHAPDPDLLARPAK